VEDSLLRNASPAAVRGFGQVAMLASCFLHGTPASVLADELKSVPVTIGGDAESDACGATGRVAEIRGGLSVRVGPGIAFRRVDSLKPETVVTICEERPTQIGNDANDYWYGVVYGRPRQDCGTGTPRAGKVSYVGPCKSGWVSKKYIRLEAG
jgi:hypothetical protein